MIKHSCGYIHHIGEFCPPEAFESASPHSENPEPMLCAVDGFETTDASLMDVHGKIVHSVTEMALRNLQNTRELITVLDGIIGHQQVSDNYLRIGARQKVMGVPVKVDIGRELPPGTDLEAVLDEAFTEARKLILRTATDPHFNKARRHAARKEKNDNP